MKYKDFFYGDFTLVLYKNFVEPFLQPPMFSFGWWFKQALDQSQHATSPHYLSREGIAVVLTVYWKDPFGE